MQMMWRERLMDMQNGRALVGISIRWHHMVYTEIGI